MTFRGNPCDRVRFEVGDRVIMHYFGGETAPGVIRAIRRAVDPFDHTALVVDEYHRRNWWRLINLTHRAQ